MNILLLSDIHANYPALCAVWDFCNEIPIDIIVNAGDSLVYAPFPNETLKWLQEKGVHSILGNTDTKVIDVLKGKGFSKPRLSEKRIMYTWTAETLTPQNAAYLTSLPTSTNLFTKVTLFDELPISVHHGSPERDHEFLFPDTNRHRFEQLASLTPAEIVIIGHSHSPFHKYIGSTHFINPGSVGRMFDSNPTASFAILSMSSQIVQVTHFRVPYCIQKVIDSLQEYQLPSIYCEMYRLGRKLN